MRKKKVKPVEEGLNLNELSQEEKVRLVQDSFVEHFSPLSKNVEACPKDVLDVSRYLFNEGCAGNPIFETTAGGTEVGVIELLYKGVNAIEVPGDTRTNFLKGCGLQCSTLAPSPLNNRGVRAISEIESRVNTWIILNRHDCPGNPKRGARLWKKWTQPRETLGMWFVKGFLAQLPLFIWINLYGMFSSYADLNSKFPEECKLGIRYTWWIMVMTLMTYATGSVVYFFISQPNANPRSQPYYRRFLNFMGIWFIFMCLIDYNGFMHWIEWMLK